MSEIEVRYKKAKKKNKIEIPFSRIISYFLIISGLLLIIYINAPILWDYVNISNSSGEGVGYSDEVTLAEVYDPELSYIENLFVDLENYYRETSFVKSGGIVDTSYGKQMYISIPSVGIENTIITPNVESFDKKVYDKYLYKGVAHFKYTPLPGDGGNSFIYGHSGDNRYYKRNPNNPHIIFTKLKDIKIGDTVLINRDDKLIEYRVITEKIVSTDDISIIEGVKGKETLTLMTCYPWGIGTHRYVVVAEKIGI